MLSQGKTRKLPSIDDWEYSVIFNPNPISDPLFSYPSGSNIAVSSDKELHFSTAPILLTYPQELNRPGTRLRPY